MKLYTEIETESSWILTSNRPQRCVHIRTGEKWERGEVMAREVERGREREKVGRGKGERQKTDEGEKKDDVYTEGVGGQREMR